MQCSNIEEVRSNIDRIDSEIIKLIAERRKFVLQVIKFKENEADVKVPDREEAVIANVRNKAAEYGADADMVENIYREMISGFIKLELQEISKGNKTLFNK